MTPKHVQYHCQKCIDKWGEKAQVLQMLEEMAELQKELLKNINRGEDNTAAIVDEVVDIEFMLEQLKYMYKIHDAVEAIKPIKQNRYKSRYPETCDMPIGTPTELRAFHDKIITMVTHEYLVLQTLEELSELQKELLKYTNRGKETMPEIIEELADLEIMMAYIKIIFNIEDAVEKHIPTKIEKLEKQLKE